MLESLEMLLVCFLCLNSALSSQWRDSFSPADSEEGDKTRSPKKQFYWSCFKLSLIKFAWMSCHDHLRGFIFFSHLNFKNRSFRCVRNCLPVIEDIDSVFRNDGHPQSLMRCSIADNASAYGQYPRHTVVFIMTSVMNNHCSIFHWLKLIKKLRTETFTVLILTISVVLNMFQSLFCSSSMQHWRTSESHRTSAGLRLTEWPAKEPCSCVSLRLTPTSRWTVSRTLGTGAWEWPSLYACSCMERYKHAAHVV